MTDETLYKLINPEFDFEWNGEMFHIKKANITKVVQYQQRARELAEKNEVSTELKLGAYALYLVLKESKPDLTEEFVLENTPGDIDVLDLFVRLGFLNPARIKAALQILSQTGDKSLSPSPKEQDGNPGISEI